MNRPSIVGGQSHGSRESHDRRLFNKIAEKYARKDTIASCRIARKHRLLRTLAQVPIRSDMAIMEAGCGGGFAARYLKGKYGSYCGIDYSENLIDYARTNNAYPNVSFYTTNIKDFKPEQRFDVIFLVGVLHHMDDVTSSISALVDMLPQGGWLITNEPQSSNPLIRLARYLRMRFDKNYSGEQKPFSVAELRAVFECAGLRDVRVVPQGIFSTPLAEVSLRPMFLWRVAAGAACVLDGVLERALGSLLSPFSWNLIAVGRKVV